MNTNTSPLLLVALTCLILHVNRFIQAKSIIVANYHNLLLFFPKEYGGNDDLRVIFDVRNVTAGTFKYMPVIVDVAYDSEMNNAYCYMESAVTSYIMLLKWSGGNWCYQVLFEFPASQFQKYMYHSILLMKDFVYWTVDRYVMSGRLPGFEKRALLQPSWNRIYSMTVDRPKEILYVAGFDYTENALFRCNLRLFNCEKFLTPKFTINSIYFNSISNDLYVSTVQGGPEQNFLYRYKPELDKIAPVQGLKSEVASILFLAEDFAIYTDQKSLLISPNVNMPNSSRRALAKLIDPYAMQYVFTFNQAPNFDTYPFPYFFSDYHDLLYRNSLFLFYFYITNMDYVENDHVFLPQMDLNNRFVRIENCQVRFLNEREAYLIPSIVAGSVSLALLLALVLACMWRSKMCQQRADCLRDKLHRAGMQRTPEFLGRMRGLDRSNSNKSLQTGAIVPVSPVMEKKRGQAYNDYLENNLPHTKIYSHNPLSYEQQQHDSLNLNSTNISPPPPLYAVNNKSNAYNSLNSSALNNNNNTNKSFSPFTNIFTTQYSGNTTPPFMSEVASSDQDPINDASISTNDLVYNPINFKDTATPTFSFTSSNGSNARNSINFHSPNTIAPPSSNNTKANNRVKFNDTNVHHVYNQYESPLSCNGVSVVSNTSPMNAVDSPVSLIRNVGPGNDVSRFSNFQFYDNGSIAPVISATVRPLEATSLVNYLKTVDSNTYNNQPRQQTITTAAYDYNFNKDLKYFDFMPHSDF